MRIKCEKCSHSQDITLDNIIFDTDDEESFIRYLAAEMTKSESSTTE